MQAKISIGIHLLNSLLASLDKTVGRTFSSYVHSLDTHNWLIFSDYVLRQPQRPTDVFAFTIVPGGRYLTTLTTDFQRTAKHDFKDIKKVDDAMLRLLSDKRLFTFCFRLDPFRVLLGKAAKVREILAREIATLNVEDDAGARAEGLRWASALKVKAAANGFKVRLLDDIIIASTLASFISVLICKTRRAARIGWFSDRDDITTAHNSIAYYLYQSCTTGSCMQEFEGWRGPALGVNGVADIGQTPWSDPFIRVPDYFAGMISAWNFETDEIPETPPKYQQILARGIAGHPNVQIVRLLIEHDNDLVSFLTQTFAISPKQ